MTERPRTYDGIIEVPQSTLFPNRPEVLNPENYESDLLVGSDGRQWRAEILWYEGDLSPKDERPPSAGDPPR